MTSNGYADGPSGAHNAYFSMLNALLKENGSGHPVILLDMDTLDQNISVLKKKIAAPKSFRVVVKSLPCIELIRHVMSFLSGVCASCAAIRKCCIDPTTSLLERSLRGN